MKKTLIIIVLLILIIVSFAFVFLKMSSRGSEFSFFNQNLRYRFGEYQILRQIFALHNDGDARLAYLGAKHQKILIEVDQMIGLDRNLEITDNLLQKLAEKIKNITGKETSFKYSNITIPYSPAATAEELRKIEEEYRNHDETNKEAVVYLLLAIQEGTDLDKLGSTLGEEGIILFQKTFKDSMLKTDARSDTYDNFILSTLLHEFGHQIGLPHNIYPDCLMNAQTEFSNQIRPDRIINDFCDYEKEEIKKTLAAYQKNRIFYN